MLIQQKKDDSVLPSQETGWWIYCIAGLLSAVSCMLIIKLIHGPLAVRLPREYFELSVQSMMQENNYAIDRQVQQLLHTHYLQTFGRLLALLTISICSIFGLLVGWSTSGWRRGLLAVLLSAIGGTCVSIVISPVVILLPRQLAMTEMDSLLRAILTHATTWLIIGAVLLLIIGYARRSYQVLPRTAVGIFLGLTLGVVITVLISASIEYSNHVERQIINGDLGLLLWSTLPITLIGFFLAFVEVDKLDPIREGNR